MEAEPSLDYCAANGGSAAKKTKGDDLSRNGDSCDVKLSVVTVEGSIAALEHFGDIQFKSILNNSVDFKRVFIEGIYKEHPAVVILDKKPFNEETLKDGFFQPKSRLERLFQNDIYGSYSCIPVEAACEIKATIIAPATQKHIDKYKFYPFYLVEETKDIYDNVTISYLANSSFSVNWVYNVLDHKKEADRIVFEDTDPITGFILAPDLKWDGKSIEDLYLTAIVHRRDIKSLRELTAEHLTLLENVLEKGTKAIVDKYGVKRSRLRVYVHYQPSYYHLHIHFNSVSNHVGGIFTEKAHLLSTVINNIKLDGNYYAKATIPFVVKETDELYRNLQQYGYEF